MDEYTDGKLKPWCQYYQFVEIDSKHVGRMPIKGVWYDNDDNDDDEGVWYDNDDDDNDDNDDDEDDDNNNDCDGGDEGWESMKMKMMTRRKWDECGKRVNYS